jgi:hypothetical protein
LSQSCKDTELSNFLNSYLLSVSKQPVKIVQCIEKKNEDQRAKLLTQGYHVSSGSSGAQGQVEMQILNIFHVRCN